MWNYFLRIVCDEFPKFEANTGKVVLWATNKASTLRILLQRYKWNVRTILVTFCIGLTKRNFINNKRYTYMSCFVLQNEKMLELRIYYIREKQNCTTIVQPVNLLTVEKKGWTEQNEAKVSWLVANLLHWRIQGVPISFIFRHFVAKILSNNRFAAQRQELTRKILDGNLCSTDERISKHKRTDKLNVPICSF